MSLSLSLREVENLRLTSPVPLNQHPSAVYLASLSEGSLPTMKQTLNEMASMLTNGRCDASTLNWAALRYKHTSAIRTALKQKYAPATANKMLCALKRVLKEASRLDLIDPLDYAKAVDLKSISYDSRLKGRALSKREISDLIDVCKADPTRKGARDVALIAILRGAGLRRAEVVKLNLKDIDTETGALEIHRGKGGKDRLVYLPQSAIAYIKNWIEVRGDKPGPLLCPIRKGGQLEFRHMCPDAVLKIVRRRAKQAGVDSFSPHDFRRTFCSDLLDAGIDIVTVQKLAGHASVETTAKYDRRGEEVKRKAVQKLDF